MAIKVREITLWRAEVENRPGTMARVLGPLAEAGADLSVVMGYRYPENENKAAIEVYPVSGKKLTAAAREGGLSPASFPALLVEGDNAAGLGSRFARTLADAGINISFLVTHVIGRKFSSVAGFETREHARAAAALLRKSSRKKSRGR